MAFRSARFVLPVTSALPVLAAALAGGCAEPAAPPPPVAPLAAPADPHALRLALGTAPPRDAALLQAQGRRRLWRTADGVAVQTEGPRVVATAGLPWLVMATRFEAPDPLGAPEALLAREVAAQRLLDLATADRDPNRMIFGAGLACRLSARPVEAAVLEVEERCQGPARIGAFTNRFTLRRSDGALLGSAQWVGPGLPPLVTGPMPAD